MSIRKMINELIAERARIVADMRGLIETRSDDGKFRNKADELAYLDRDAEVSALTLRIEELIDLDVENRKMEEQRQKYADVIRRDVAVNVGHTDHRAKEENEAVEAMLRGEIRSVELTFDKRDLNTETTTAGGHLVPTGFRAILVDAIRHESTMLNVPGILEIATGSDGADLDVPLLTSHGTAAIVGEGSAIAEADPAFNKRTLGAWKVAQLAQATNEVVSDSRLDIPSMLARELGRAVGYAAGTFYVTGTGTNQPEGFTINAGTAVAAGTVTGGVPSADELVDTFYALSPELRSRGVWIMSDSAAKGIRKIKDGNDRPLFEYESSLASGSPGVLLGRPVYVSHAMAAAGSGNASVAFMDPANYSVRTTNVRVERSDDYAFANDLVSWRAVFRTDAKLMQHAAAQLFIGGA